MTIEVIEYSYNSAIAKDSRFEPSFLKEVWPKLVELAGSEVKIYLVKNSFIGPDEFERLASEFCATGAKKIDNGIYKIPPLTDCTADQINTLKYLSFYNGHLSILYNFEIESRAAPLTSLWHRSEKYTLSIDESLGLADSVEFGDKIDKICDNGVLIGFGNDGAPLFVFRKNFN